MNSLTVFTPSYNRKKTLERLKNSLIKQSDQDFTWLIVDDGSSDGTGQMVLQWQKEVSFSLKYFYQNNHGKSYAHNVGVQNTITDLFVCVDSDDFLTPNAIASIKNEDISNTNCIGILKKRGTASGKDITICRHNIPTYVTLESAYRNYGLRGDACLVYKTEYIKKFMFPLFENEKFVPESYLYDLLDKEGFLKVSLKDTIYICEYLEDGYTNNIKRTIAKNPQGYEAYIINRIKGDKGFKRIFLDTIRYESILPILKKPILRSCPNKVVAIISLPFGLFAYIRFYLKFVD